MEPDRSLVRGKVRGLLAEASETLRQARVDTPALDSELLLAAAANVDRGKLLTGSFTLDAPRINRFRHFILRRAAREPLAYIAGHKEFYGLEFEVNRAVLIPRPETEVLVEAALKAMRRKSRARLLDLGTGSGAIAIAVAVNAPGASVVATDISAPALEVARRNARRRNCAQRINFVLGDGFAPLSCSHARFDLILSNPPYVGDEEVARLEPEVARFEPLTALRGGKDGLDFYRRITAEARPYLAPGGELMLEVGAGQAADVVRLLERDGYRVIEVLCDLAGHQRVVRANRTS
jgi:release factor glutamine methyltransferase